MAGGHVWGVVVQMEALSGDTLVVRWIDRLGRNYQDICETIREFMQRGVVIRTVINGITFDGATKAAILDDALGLHDAKKARVIPVILRNCLWNRTPFAKLQALPKDGMAVAKWDSRDEAWTNVAEGVRRAAEEMLGIKS
jgi:hypothetical protein